MVVVDYVANGGRRWQMLAQRLPIEVLNFLHPIFPPSDEFEDDSIIWSASKSGEFTLKSAW